MTTSLIGSSTVDAAGKGNLQGGPDYRVQIVKKKKKKIGITTKDRRDI